MCGEVSRKEQEQQFEEELRKASDNCCSDIVTMATDQSREQGNGHEEFGEEDEDVDEGMEVEDEEFCKNCQRLMSHLRKSAVRWLYMEWYKKAVLGLQLPTVSS